MEKQSYQKPEFKIYGKISTITEAQGAMTVRDNPAVTAMMNKSARV